MDHFIHLYLCVFFYYAEELASKIDVNDEPRFSSLEFDQVCFVFFITRMFIDLKLVIYHQLNSHINKYHSLLKFKILL